jgi:hypothetical protein
MTTSSGSVNVADLPDHQRALFHDVLRHNDAPEKQHSRAFTVRLPEFQLAMLKVMADKQGTTASDLARIALQSGLASQFDSLPEDLRPTGDEIVAKLGEGSA